MPRRTARQRDAASGDEGFSIIETIVALFIVGIVMTAAAAFFINSLKNSGLQSQRQTAITVATQAIEATQAVAATRLVSGRSQAAVDQLMATDPTFELTLNDRYDSNSWDTSLPAASQTNAALRGLIPTTAIQTVNNVDYTVRTFLNLCNLDNATRTCVKGAPTGSVAVYRATVAVTWTPGGGLSCDGGCRYTATTLFDKQNDPRFNSNISQPRITALSLLNVPAPPTLTITGVDFVAGAVVTIAPGGGTFGTVISNSGTVIKIPFTPGPPGTYPVAVTNPDGGRAVSNLVIGAEPVITAVSPASLAFAAETTVTITGRNFRPGPGSTVSMTSGTAVVTASSPTSITVKLRPDGTQAGTATITVRNPDGLFGTFPIGLTRSVPTVTGGTQTGGTAPVGQATQVTLTGTNFAPSVSVGASTGTVSAVTYVSSTSLVVSFTPSAANASTTFTVTNPDGGTANRAVTVATRAVPTITAVNQASTPPVGIGRQITLTGTNFVSGLTLTPSTGTITAPQFISATSVSFTFTPSTANASTTFTVTNPDTGTASRAATITTNASPTITNAAQTGAVAAVGQATQVTLTGTSFVSGVAITASAGTVSAPEYLSATSLRFTYTPSSEDPSVVFTVRNPDGGTASRALVVSTRSTPTATNLNPKTVKRGTNTAATVTGTGFENTTTPRPTVTIFIPTFGYTVTQDATSTTSTLMNFVFAVPADAPPGTYSVVTTVRNADGGSASYTTNVTVTA